jgi:hypothetical protein
LRLVTTKATTGSTLLHDIAKAMGTKQADERPIYRRAARLFADLNGWRWDPAFPVHA